MISKYPVLFQELRHIQLCQYLQTTLKKRGKFTYRAET